MSNFGFKIIRLTLSGPGLVDADLQFHDGLNVIVGPSDTGKTFALQCIDFMLGARSIPKPIPEVAGYNTASLEIIGRNTGERFLLRRALGGGDFCLEKENGEELTLAAVHAVDNEDTVSHIYLDLSGLAHRKIRKNARGETRSLSFRNVSHQCIVSEEKIIDKGSPFLSGHRTEATSEKSVFRLFLSGVDDSAIVQAEDSNRSKDRIEGKKELLEGLIRSTKERLEALQVSTDLESLESQQTRLEHSIEEIAKSLEADKVSVVSLERARREAWECVRKVESKLDVLSELKARFALLHGQYESDIARLDAISESGKRLGEINLEYCPVCGADATAHDPDHQEWQTDPVAVAASCESEAQRVLALKDDLSVTQSDIEGEIAELSRQKAEYETELGNANRTLQECLNPRIEQALTGTRTLQEKMQLVQKAIAQYEQLAELGAIRDSLSENPPAKAENQEFADLDSQNTDSFAMQVQSRLGAWKFPDLGRVVFDTENSDIVINGRERSSHGKGIRAVTHAAFTLSVLRYCLDGGLPHPSFVLLDSPLVVYEAPDTGEEGFSQDVKAAFFSDLEISFRDAQVFVLENNKSVPDDLESSGLINVIRFTKSGQGRYGFIPPCGKKQEGEST